jgi:stage V sporulation protein B
MNSTLARGTVYITISTIVFVFSSYLINIILGRVLGPAGYGIYGVIITLMTTINLTQTSGLPLAVSKFIASDEKNADSILKSGLILQIISTLIASLLFLALTEPLAHLLKDESLAPYIQLSAAVFPLYGIYSIYMNYYNGLHKFRTQALMNIVYSIAKLVSVLMLVYFFHVYGAIVGFIISPFIALLFWTHIPKGVRQHFSYKKLIFFSLPLIGLAIFSTLLQSIDLLFTKALLHSNTSTGFYTAGQNISKIPFYCVTALASVLFPSISRSISEKSEDKTKNLIVKSIRFTLLILLPIILMIAVTSTQLMDLFYSSAYESGAAALSILIIGIGFFTIFTILTTIISSSGSPYKAFWLSGIGVLLTSFLCYILIPLKGIEGAATATTISTFLITILSAIIVYKQFKVLVNLKSTVKIFFAALIISGIAKFIVLPVLLLPLLYIVLVFLYVFILFILKEISEEDIKLVKSLLPNWLMKKLKI